MVKRLLAGCMTVLLLVLITVVIALIQESDAKEVKEKVKTTLTLPEELS